MINSAAGKYLDNFIDFGEHRGKILSAIVFMIFLFLVFMRVSVITYWQTDELNPAKIFPLNGHAYIFEKHFWFTDETEAGVNLKILENDTPVASGFSSANDVGTLGMGRYLVFKNFIIFSASDNSDPRTNNRTYTIRYRLAPSNIFLFVVGSLFLFLNYIRLRRLTNLIADYDPMAILLSLVVAAFIFRLYTSINYWDAQLFGHSIKGVPFSDASMWYKLGVNYAHGNDVFTSASYWDGRRHGYAWFLSAIFNLFGESVTNVRIVHIILGAVSAGLIFDISRRLLPVPLAIFITFTHALNTYSSVLALSTLTEPLGYFLTNLALWFLIVGLWQFRYAPGNRVYIYLFASGIIFGYSNLVRPLTLGSVLPIALFLTWYFYDKQINLKQNFGTISKPVAAFILGITIIITPWLLRQYLTYDILTITDNTAESLYAATSPEYGTWSSVVTANSEKANPQIRENITKRYQYFSEKAKRNLAENFSWYIKNALFQVYRQLLSLSPPKWVLVLCVVLFAIYGRSDNEKENRKKILISLGALFTIAAMSTMVYSHFTLMLLLMGSLIATSRGIPICVLAILFIVSVCSLGAMGINTDPRFNYSLLWISSALTTWFVWILLNYFINRKIDICEFYSMRSHKNSLLEKPVHIFTVLAAGLFLVGHFGTVIAKISPDEVTSSSLPEQESETIISNFLSHDWSSAYLELKDLLIVYKTRPRKGFSIALAENENLRRWSAIFEPRTYPYSLNYMIPPIEIQQHEELAAIIPGKQHLDTSRAYFLVGIAHTGSNASTFEVIATANADGNVNNLQWVLPEAKTSTAHVAHILEILDRDK